MRKAAVEGADLSALEEAFAESFAEPLPGAPAPYAVALADAGTVPGKPGARAIRLVPENGGPMLDAGWVDPSRREAELNGWAQLMMLRRGRAVGIPDEAAYRAFLASAGKLLEKNRIRVVTSMISRSPTEELQAMAEDVESSGRILFVELGLVLILALGVLGLVYFSIR